MATSVEVEQRHSGTVGHDSSWKVIVKNDDHNTFEHVASTLARVIPGVSLAKGMDFANRIHTEGSVIVWAGHLELAEHYWELLDEAGLTLAPLEQH